jgi:hypothetical protein
MKILSQVFHSKFQSADLSMVPFDHTVRIQAIERVAAALTASGLRCEVLRVPAASENCFLEELSLKVTIP